MSDNSKWKLPPEELRKLMELRRSSASSRHRNKTRYNRKRKHGDVRRLDAGDN